MRPMRVGDPPVKWNPLERTVDVREERDRFSIRRKNRIPHALPFSARNNLHIELRHRTQIGSLESRVYNLRTIRRDCKYRAPWRELSVLSFVSSIENRVGLTGGEGLERKKLKVTAASAAPARRNIAYFHSGVATGLLRIASTDNPSGSARIVSISMRRSATECQRRLGSLAKHRRSNS